MSLGTDISHLPKMYGTAVPENFPQTLTPELEKMCSARYGENPGQPAALYYGNAVSEMLNIRTIKDGKEGISVTNLRDIGGGIEVLKYFERPAVTIMKHGVPAGFDAEFTGVAVDTKTGSLARTYSNAYDADARSAYGGTIVLNRPLDRETVEAIGKRFVEVIAAPEFEEGVVGMLENKERLRVLRFDNLERIPKYAGDAPEDLFELRGLPGGYVFAQRPFLSKIRGPQNIITDPSIMKDNQMYTALFRPTDEQLMDMLTSWYVNIGVKSNGVVLVKGGVTIAIGSGEQERIGALEQALTKAYQKAMDRYNRMLPPEERISYNPLHGMADWHLFAARGCEDPVAGSVLSSDGFFPKRDSIDLAGETGVAAIIQPGGAQSDHLIIEAANENQIPMCMTGERIFNH